MQHSRLNLATRRKGLRSRLIVVALGALIGCSPGEGGAAESESSNDADDSQSSEAQTGTDLESGDTDTQSGDATQEEGTGDEGSTETGGDGDCVSVTASEWIGLGEGVDAILGPAEPSLGDPEVNDVVQIELYGDLPPLNEAIDLSFAAQDNYSSCEQCVRVLEDIVGQAVAKQYFQVSGSITFEEIAGLGQWRGHIDDVHLVEVSVDASFVSTPVRGGGCVDLVGELAFDTLPGG